MGGAEVAGGVVHGEAHALVATLKGGGMGRVYEDIELHGPRTGLTVNDRRCAYFNQLGVEDVAWLDARAHGGNRDRGAGVRRGGEIHGMVIEALQHRGGNNRRGAGHEGNPPTLFSLAPNTMVS